MFLCPIKCFTIYCFSKILQDNKYNIFIAEIDSNNIFFEKIYLNAIFHTPGRHMSGNYRSISKIACKITQLLPSYAPFIFNTYLLTNLFLPSSSAPAERTFSYFNVLLREEGENMDETTIKHLMFLYVYAKFIGKVVLIFFSREKACFLYIFCDFSV